MSTLPATTSASTPSSAPAHTADRPARRVRTLRWLPVCLVVAVLLGLASGWAEGPALLFTVASMQSVWALGACACGALVGGRRPLRGAAGGALFGATAILAYYGYELATYGVAATLHELESLGGEFWIGTAAVGGALMGANGVVLTRWSTGRLLDPTAMAHALLAGVLASEAAFVLTWLHHFDYWQSAREVSIGLLGVAAVLGVRTLRRSGLRATLLSFGLAATCAPFATAAFLLFERAFGYSTI